MPDVKYFSNVQSKSTGDVYVVKDEGAREQIDDIYKYNGEMGAKNLLVPEWVETHTTENGVTYTFNADGTIIMNTDASGATANTNCNLRQNTVTTNNVFPAGTYTLTACPAGGSSTTYRTWARAYRPGTNTALTDNLYEEGNGVSFTVSEPFSLGLNASVRSGYVCNNLTWKPMLRYASDTDNTYQPYAKTNRQLTEDIAVPKYDPVDECIYYEGGDQFTGAIDSAPTAGSSNAVSSGGTKTYVDSAIAGVSVNGQYAECSTARNVTAKTVTLPGFELKTGSKITVRFTDTGTTNPESGHITLNVNGTGAKEIADGHTNMSILGATSGSLFYNNQVLDFIYDGTYWVYLNRDNNTTYSSKAAASGGTATSLCTTGEKYTWNNKQNALTFDSAPTQGSGNPVTSGGVFSSLGVPKIDTTTGVMYLEGGAAFSGNIDSTPTANSNNAVASGGTKTYVDNAINTALNNSKIAVFTKTFNDVTIDRAWGVLYESLQQQFDISSLGLQSPPKAVYLGIKSSPNAVMFELLSPAATSIPFHFLRPNQVTTAINITATALVIY